MVMSTFCSCRRPNFGSQHSLWVSEGQLNQFLLSGRSLNGTEGHHDMVMIWKMRHKQEK